MIKNAELLKQLREILEPPDTNPLANDVDTKLRMLEKFINSRYVPKATHDKKLNGFKHREMKSAQTIKEQSLTDSTNDKDR